MRSVGGKVQGTDDMKKAMENLNDRITTLLQERDPARSKPYTHPNPGHEVEPLGRSCMRGSRLPYTGVTSGTLERLPWRVAPPAMATRSSHSLASSPHRHHHS